MNTKIILLIGIAYILPMITLLVAKYQKRHGYQFFGLFVPILNWIPLIKASTESIKFKKRDDVPVRCKMGLNSSNQIQQEEIKSFQDFKQPMYQKVPTYWYWTICLILFLFKYLGRKIGEILSRI